MEWSSKLKGKSQQKTPATDKRVESKLNTKKTSNLVLKHDRNTEIFVAPKL